MWADEIHKRLNSAHIILLLVSPDFIDSDYCYGTEMKQAMERHERGEACVIPVILRQVYWQDMPFGKLQALPTDAKPVMSRHWFDQDEALNDVAQGIRNAIQKQNTIQKLPNQNVKPPVVVEQHTHVSPSQTSPAGNISVGVRVKKMQLVDEGIRFRDAHKYTEALAKFEEALKLDPYDAVIYGHKGYVLGEIKQYHEAVKAFEQALWLNPKDIFAWINKGRALNELKQYKEGLEACEEALRLEPRNVTAHNNKSWSLIELKEYEKVLIACEEALRIDPNNGIAYNNKGAALEGLRRYEEACVAYGQALRINPHNAVAFNNFKRLNG